MLLPYLDEGRLVPAYDIAYDIVAAEAARCGFGVLDLRARVREAGPARLAISPRDQVHYNALGHAMIARWLGRRLVEDGAVTR